MGHVMPRKVKTESGDGLGMRIGRNSKIAGVQIGIAQSEMAEARGADPVTVSCSEAATQLLSIDRLTLITKILKASLPALVSDADKSDIYGALLAEVIKGLSIDTQDLPASTDARMQDRFLTVSLYPEPKPRIPWIRLRGLWLKQAGFTSKSRIRVQVMTGCLVITKE